MQINVVTTKIHSPFTQVVILQMGNYLTFPCLVFMELSCLYLHIHNKLLHSSIASCLSLCSMVGFHLSLSLSLSLLPPLQGGDLEEEDEPMFCVHISFSFVKVLIRYSDIVSFLIILDQ